MKWFHRNRSPEERIQTSPPGNGGLVEPTGPRTEIYPALLLVVVLFAMVIPWHAFNQRLPIWDSANYVLNVQNILSRFDTGAIDGLKGLYFERGWRPIIFPALATPFFWMAERSILGGVALTQFAGIAVLGIYLYRFFRQTLSPGRAIAGSLLLCGMPWLVGYTNVLYSELYWLAAASGCLHHTALALRERSGRQFVLGGIWLGLMGAIRPVETALLSALPVLALLHFEYRRGRLPRREALWYLGALLLTGAAVGWLTQPETRRSVPYLMVLAATTVLLLRRRHLLASSPFLGYLGAAQSVAVAWHLPTVRLLYLWAYDTSFGSLAKLTDQEFLSVPPWTIFWRLLQQYSPDLLFALIACTLIALVLPSGAKGRGVLKTHMALLALSALAMIPMLWMLSRTGTSDMRRVMPPMLFLYIGLAGLALAPSGLGPRLRFAAITATALLMATAATANGLRVRLPAVLVSTASVFGHLRAPDTGTDPNVPVLDGLIGLGIKSGRISAHTYCYRDYANCERLRLPMFEPVALSTLATERGLPIYVHFMGDLDFSKPATLAEQIKARDFEYILVDMFDSPADVNWQDPYVEHTRQFIDMAKAPLPEGIVARGCFETVGRRICVFQVPR